MMTELMLPPEWSKQKAVWLSWPHNKETWEIKELKKVESEYTVFIKELLSEVIVNLLIVDNGHKNHVKKIMKLNDDSQIRFHLIKTNDAWIRDYGPDFVWNKINKRKELLNWGYNAWGGKYPPYNDDNAVPLNINEKLELSAYTIPMILEGGSFEVNGKGDLLTTASCLLNPNRNPQLSKKVIEDYLKHFFGINQIIWLKEGIKGDDTDGHIDDFVRFIDETTIVYACTEDSNHPDYEVLKQVQEQLSQVKLWNNKTPKLIPLPTPTPLFYEGEMLPCSYANFLITNNKILVPTFGCQQDKVAIERIQKQVVDRKVIGIPANNIIIGLGSLHCLSKQEFDSTIFE